MADMHIQLQSKAMPVSGIEVDTLGRVCQENNIDFSSVAVRMDGVQASAIWSWVTLYFSSEVIEGIVAGMLSAAAYDVLKTAVKGVVNAIRAKISDTNKSKKSAAIELKSPSATLRIETDRISDQTLSEAFDAFVKVSEITANKEGRRVITTYIVIDSDIKVITQNEYITRYIIPKKDEADDKRG